MAKIKRLLDIYRFPGFVPSSTLRGVFGDHRPGHLVAPPSKKTVCGVCGEIQFRHYDKRPRRVRDLSCGDRRIYRIVVSDLIRGRPIWFGGEDRSEKSLDAFFAWFGPANCGKIRIAVMDMWKAFRNSTLKEGHRRP